MKITPVSTVSYTTQHKTTNKEHTKATTTTTAPQFQPDCLHALLGLIDLID